MNPNVIARVIKALTAGAAVFGVALAPGSVDLIMQVGLGIYGLFSLWQASKEKK